MAGPSRIDELRKKFDENPRRYFAPLANEYRKIGDFEQAIFICQEFLPQQPGHMSGHIVYGQALFESGRHDEARSVFETALALDPENLIALRHLGDIARAHGDNETAGAWYRRVLESDPRNEEIAAILSSLDSGGTTQAPTGFEPTSTAPATAEQGSTAAAGGSGDQAASVPAAASSDPIVTEPLTSAPAEGNFDDIAKLFTSAPSAAPEPPLMEGTPSQYVGSSNSGAFTFIHEGEDVLGAAAQLGGQARGESPIESIHTGNEASQSEPHALDRESAIDSAAPSPFLAELTTPEPAAAPPAPTVEPPAPPPAAAASDASTPFVTETMAELYVQQGHVDRALDVYRQLVQRRPNEAALASRLRELERLAEGPPAPEATAPAHAAEAVAEAGPTIRDFLAAIAEFRPRGAASPNGSATADLPMLEPAPAPSGREAPHEQTVGGSLHNLFTGAERGHADAPPPADLPSLTTGGPPAAATGAAIPGRPAPAPTELSLDHVFRHATPAAGAGTQSSFSFDQFFSQQAQHDVSAHDAEPASESAGTEKDDIQQFNAWLEGLKKS